MKRRSFLRHLPGIGFFLFKINNAFSRTLLDAMNPFLQRSAPFSLKIIGADAKVASELPVHLQRGIIFVSASKWAQAFQFHTYENEEKRKIVIYLPHNKMVLTAENPFIVLDNQTYQMPVSTLWRDNEILMPLNFSLKLINRYTTVSFQYDPERYTLKMSDKNYNVTGIEIDSRENGTAIRIRTTRKYQDGEMTMDMRYGWLHVDLFKGKGDAGLLQKMKTAGLVREIKVFQFKDLLSLAFRLRREPLQKEIFQDPLTNDVVVVLRTKEKISEEDDLAEPANTPEESSDMEDQLAEEKKRWLIDTIVIDAGHGGKDPGAIGIKKLYEKEVVLAVALKLGRLIERNLRGVKVIYTRKGDDFIALRRRTQIANENNGKLFISIHANWSKNKRASGFETYILGPEKGDRARDVVLKENSVIKFEDPKSQKGYEGINMILATMAQSAFMRQSEHLASLIHEELKLHCRSINLKGRGVKQGPFWVMVGASMPSVLVETGFITNPYEARILRTAQYQQKIAEGIFAGLKRFKEDYESAI